MKKCHDTDGTKQKRYYATQDRNGTEDELTIRTPDGRSMAFIWFLDEQDEVAKPQSDQAKADALLIVQVLNDHQKRLARRKAKMMDDERAAAKARTTVNANLRKSHPKLTAHKV